MPGGLNSPAAPRIAIPLLLGLGLVLFAVNLGAYPFYTKGEPREGVTVLAMVQGGGLILPLRAGIEIPSKPPLMHWLAALASVAAGGVTEATVRLPSALLAIGGIIACYLYLRLLFDDERALLAALILATTFQYLQAGTGARVDMTLTFFMELAFFEILAIAEGLSGRWPLLYGALALAVLSKGPVGAVLPGLTASIWILYERRWEAIRQLRPLYGIPIVIVIAGGWYVGAAIVRGAAFVHKQLLAENLFRIIHSGAVHEGHAHPFYYLIFALLAGFMPWTLLAPAAWLGYVRRKGATAGRIRYLVVWCIVVFAVYDFAQSKRGVYLLAMYPALAALLGIAIADAVESGRSWMTPVTRTAGFVLLVSAAAGAVAMLLLTRNPHPIAALMVRIGWTNAALMPALIQAAANYLVVAVLLLLAAAALGLWLLVRGPGNRMVLASAVGIACFVLITNLIVIPTTAKITSLRDFTRAAMRIVDDHRVAYFGGIDYEIAFYSDRTIPVLTLGARWTPEFLFCWRNIYDALPPAAQHKYSIASESQPTELDGGGTMLLLQLVKHPSTH